MLTMFATVIPPGPAIANKAYAECLIVPSSYPKLIAFLEKSSSIFKTVSGSNVFGSVEIGFLFFNFCSNAESGFVSISSSSSSSSFPFSCVCTLFFSSLWFCCALPTAPFSFVFSFRNPPPKLELSSSSSVSTDALESLFCKASISFFPLAGERGGTEFSFPSTWTCIFLFPSLLLHSKRDECRIETTGGVVPVICVFLLLLLLSLSRSRTPPLLSFFFRFNPTCNEDISLKM